MRRVGVLASVLSGLGLFAVLVARKVMSEGTAHDSVLWFGVACVVVATAWRAFEQRRAVSAAKTVETALLAASAGITIAIGLYGLSTDAGLEMLGQSAGDEESRLGPILGVLWPAVLTVSASALLFMELAYRRMPIPEAVEQRRVFGAAIDGTAIALTLVFAFSMSYVANVREWRKDLTYFQTTKPSETTLRMVRSIDEPVQAVLFYPGINEVKDQLLPYFRELDRASDKFSIKVRDHALAPDLVQRHRVRGNGWIVLLRGSGEGQTAESFDVGTELEVARSRLRTLDGRFQRTFARLVMQRREISLTAGHDERSASGIEGDAAGARTRDLMDALSRSNITTTQLGMAQGLGSDVPNDTPAVMVVGPRKPLLPEEAESLLRYVRGGGRLVVMADPDEDHGLDPLLHGLGVQILPGVLASETEYIRRTATLADRAIVRSSRYSSHPTVTIASRHASELATVLVRGGAVGRYEGEGAPEGVRVDFPIRSGDRFFRDLDGDFERDENEPFEVLQMMAAVTVPNRGGEEGRAIVVADGDFVTDQVIRNPGNALVFGDIIQWLIGQEQILGDVSSEEDVQIEHTPEEDKLWFWGTSFGVPLPFFGIAIWVALRRTRRRSQSGGAPKAPAKEKEPAKAEAKRAEDEEEDEDEDEDEGEDEEEESGSESGSGTGTGTGSESGAGTGSGSESGTGTGTGTGSGSGTGTGAGSSTSTSTSTSTTEKPEKDEEATK